MKPCRPTALIQVDLDSLWAVKTVYGLPVQKSDIEDDPFYALGMGRFLDLFEQKKIRATFFAIGRDCEAPVQRTLLRQAAEAGHEIANHSHTHPIGLGTLPPEIIAREIEQASAAIEKITGRRPAGFRAPGFDASPAVLQAAAQQGLLYDSSLLPTRVGFLLRRAAAFFKQKGASAARKGHYGTGPVWKAPRWPYYPDLEAPWKSRGLLPLDEKNAPAPPDAAPPQSRKLIELPVAVTPRLRLPVHASVGMAAGLNWTRRVLGRLANGQPPVLVYVFHGIDLVGGEEISGLPGGAAGRRVFDRPLQEKRRFVEQTLDFLLSRFVPRVSVDYLLEKTAGGAPDSPESPARPSGVW